MSHRVLVAFFPHRIQARAALRELAAIGMPPSDLSLLPNDDLRPDDLALTTESKASEGAAIGFLLGALAGALGGGVVAAGSLVVPRLDLVLAGPIVASLAAAGALGAAAALAGAIVGAAIPEFEVRYLENAIVRGGSLLAVRCPAQRAHRVVQVLESTGGRCIRNRRAF